MIGKLTKVAYNFGGHIKNLKTTAVSTPTGLTVTYPHQNNRTHDIENPLETFISSLAACKTATLRGIAKQKNIKLGNITWSRIESNYDLGNWMTGGGKNNKISDIFLDVELEANLTEAEFEKVKEMVENLCPIYQVITGGGVKVNSNWKLKKIN